MELIRDTAISLPTHLGKQELIDNRNVIVQWPQPVTDVRKGLLSSPNVVSRHITSCG